MGIAPSTPTASIAVTATLTAIATVTVCLRLWSRRVGKIEPGWEDWLVTAALALVITMAVFEILGVKQEAFAYPSPPFKSPRFAHLLSLNLKYLWIIQMLGTLQIGLVKLSFAIFYRRVFGTQKSTFFTPLNTALITTIVIWTLGFWLAFLFACKGHFSAWWNGDVVSERKYCLNDPMYSEGLAISDVIIDTFIIIMPMPMVWQLHMKRSRKGLVTAVFGLGAIAVVASIIRLVFFFNAKNSQSKPTADPLLLDSEITLWTVIESCLGLTAACLPLLYGFIRRTSIDSIVRSVRSVISLQSFRSGGSRGSATRTGVQTNHAPDNGPYIRTGSASNSQTMELVPGNADQSWKADIEGKLDNSRTEERSVDLENGIRVQKQVEQTVVGR